MKFLDILFKIIMILLITFAGAAVTCGSNILIAENHTVISFINSIFPSEKIEYGGSNILFYWWGIEIVLVLIGTVYVIFWKYSAFTPQQKIAMKIVIGLLGFIGIGSLLYFFLF